MKTYVSLNSWVDDKGKLSRSLDIDNLSRAEYDALPRTDYFAENIGDPGHPFWKKTFAVGDGDNALFIHFGTEELPVPPAVPVCYICKTPLELEHATLCTACAVREVALWQDYVNASKDERPA